MSTLRTNALEGMDAKNSITIVAGAGNITTTNVQEGLNKCWINFDGSGTIATRDSFNVSGITDDSTGNDVAPTTTTYRFGALQFGTGGVDVTYVNFQIAGDLA